MGIKEGTLSMCHKCDEHDAEGDKLKAEFEKEYGKNANVYDEMLKKADCGPTMNLIKIMALSSYAAFLDSPMSGKTGTDKKVRDSVQGMLGTVLEIFRNQVARGKMPFTDVDAKPTQAWNVSRALTTFLGTGCALGPAAIMKILNDADNGILPTETAEKIVNKEPGGGRLNGYMSDN